LVIDQYLVRLFFFQVYLPGRDVEERKNLLRSPYYENPELFRGRSATALFVMGTNCPFLANSVTK
jgi:hypothetical protein